MNRAAHRIYKVKDILSFLEGNPTKIPKTETTTWSVDKENKDCCCCYHCFFLLITITSLNDSLSMLRDDPHHTEAPKSR